MPEVVRLESRPGAQIELFSTRRPGEPLGTIAIPVRDHVNAATVVSLLQTDMSWVPAGKTLNHSILQGSMLTTQRNEAVRRMEGEWLLFIDDDMVWQPDAVKRIVATRELHDIDILGGLCFRRGEPFQPTLYMRERPTDGLYNFLETWPDGDLIEVDATGMAFCLIHKRVFEMISGAPMPPLAWRTGQNGPPNFFSWRDTLGEDLRFCQDAKAAGARIFIDTSIQIGHIAEVSITRRDFLMQIALRDDETYEARKALNDGMGLPTMTAQEAKERLGWTTATSSKAPNGSRLPAQPSLAGSTRTPTSSCSRSPKAKGSGSRRSTSGKRAGSRFARN